MRRRTFLLGSAAALAGAALSPRLRRTSPRALEGELLGASFRIGHLLRGGAIPAPSSERKVAVAIVGGGVSGLSAGWKLAKAGVSDFRVLELESECGGNSRFGENAVSRYPWGAHYVPLPGPEARAVRELFAELGVIEGTDPSGRPRYREEYLCFTPQERLFLHGRWQEGILPTIGATRADFDEYERFRDRVRALKALRGADGRRAFVIPMELSSEDPALRALDRRSIRDYLLDEGFRSQRLHWYVDYACRDDFGCRASAVSAWAGLHYFASRGGDEDEDAGLVTWPEGNGWLIARLRERLAERIDTGVLVHRIEADSREVRIDAFRPAEQRTERIVAEACVLAVPKHTLPFVMPGEPLAAAEIAEFQYAPWMVANLTLDALPRERSGVPLAWDNVIHGGDSLGYVVATHQSLRTHVDQTVFTYYLPLANGTPEAGRKKLLDTPWRAWTDGIFADLDRAHPDIRDVTRRIDVFRWGHAMVRPRPGFVWGEARAHAARPIGRVQPAHSDLSGFSLFEEAQYRGVLAAERVLAQLGVRAPTSL